MYALYELTWPNRQTSIVEVATNGREVSTVKISGLQEGLGALRAYRTEDAIDAELRHMAMKQGIEVVKVQRCK